MYFCNSWLKVPQLFVGMLRLIVFARDKRILSFFGVLFRTD